MAKRVNLGEYETEEDVLDAIEQSRRITRLIISAVQKGSKFEVSQILEHYGLSMVNRLHFKVTNIVMEQWFSLMGIEDEEQIWKILTMNEYAMNKLRSIASGGTMVLSDCLTEWELGIGALQSKVIRRIITFCKEEKQQQPQSNDDDKEQSQQQINDETNDKKNEEINGDNALNNGNVENDQKENNE